jgi:RNA polymerase sigma-70 factor (ECF subfamily)
MLKFWLNSHLPFKEFSTMENKRTNLSNSDQHITDMGLINRIRKDDVKAFELLVKEYSDSLYQFALRNLKDSQAAKDIVQDVFVKIWNNRKTISIKSHVKPYLFRMVRNKSLDFVRHNAVKQQVEEYLEVHTEHVKSPEENFTDHELSSALSEAVDKLPEQCRAIFTLKKYHDFSYAEISETMNISVNTVQSQMGIAFKKLRKHLSYLFSILILN